ncbi:MAG: hypothetical protein V4572_02470 [Bacteroidota bacterium]
MEKHTYNSDNPEINTSNIKDNVQYGAFKIGDIVEQEFNTKLMKVVGFEPELVENVITEWIDETGNSILGKFMESELKIAVK